MRKTLVSILCCPICMGSLDLRKAEAKDEGSGGSLTCKKCNATYVVHKGIPKLYVSDDEIIERSDQSAHSEFIIDRNRIEALAGTVTKNPNFESRRGIFYKGISALAITAWILAALSGVLIVSGILIPSVTWALVSAVALLSCIVFLVDFVLYRTSLNERHKYQVHRLADLFNASGLSEYDIHVKQEDHDEEHDDPAEDERKAEEIGRKLDRYKATGKNGLNVGCGGELHQLISRPYFDRGFDMVGVDIFEEYLRQYSELFQTDAVQANAMALPFNSNTFDVVNYCDILEHLHHPLIGLREINRALKIGGLAIISTNYRCRLSRECANPLILIERVISLFYDKVLGPRDLLRGFRGMEFYHLDFSKKEITGLLESSGFEVLEFYTYMNKRRMLTKLFNRLPVVRFLGDAILVICRKRHDSVSNLAPVSN